MDNNEEKNQSIDLSGALKKHGHLTDNPNIAHGHSYYSNSKIINLIIRHSFGFIKTEKQASLILIVISIIIIIIATIIFLSGYHPLTVPAPLKIKVL